MLTVPEEPSLALRLWFWPSALAQARKYRPRHSVKYMVLDHLTLVTDLLKGK